MSAETKNLFDKYKLSYHFHHLEKAIELCGNIKGKSCFEIGGCLPEEIVIGHLGAAKWIGSDNLEYWLESEDRNYSNDVLFKKIAIAEADFELANHFCLDGDVTKTPTSFDGKFDFVFSTSALEHVADVKSVLKTASRLLKPGGRMFCAAMVIWPSSRGHHLPNIECNEAVYNYSNSPVPDWAHLYMSKDQMTEYLSDFPEVVSRKITYMCYESKQINRAFVEDFKEAFEESEFSSRKTALVAEDEPPEEIARLIHEKHGRKRLGVLGICLLATK